MPPWILAFEVAGAVLDAQQVVLMRISAIARCDAAAAVEAQAMVSEKIQAAYDAGLLIAGGGTAEAVVGLYRDRVRANLGRLSAPGGTAREA